MSALTQDPTRDVPAQPDADVTGPIRGLLPLALTRRRLLSWTIVAGFAYHAATVASAAAGAILVGEVASGQAAGELTGLLVVLGVAVVTAAGARWWQMWIAHDFAYSLLASLRVKVFDGLARIAPRWLQGRRTGDMAGAVMSDVEVTERFYAHTLADAVVAVVVTGGTTLALALLDARLGLLLVPFVVGTGLVPFWLGRRADAQGKALRQHLAVLNADVVDGVQGLRELVSFGQGRAYARRLARRTDDVQSSQLAYGRRSGLEAAVGDAILAAGMLAVLTVAAALVATGDLATARFPLAVLLAAYALVPLAEVSQTAREIGQIRGSARRVLTVVDHHPAVVDTATSRPRPTSWDITFDNVSFRYAADREQALDDVGFAVGDGERVALVGHSGAGKSTCINLLMRFWDPDEGSIRVGGTDLRDWPIEALRDAVALVPQDVYLFNRTLADNIRLARPDASDAEVTRAAADAMIADFIEEELAEGYDTVCGERGAELSGGQRQRIAIARALITDAPVLVMDEAVSSLDAHNERLVATAMDRAARDRTTIIIAHRLSTIRTADRIVVLESGRVAETGTHDELIARGSDSGTYARLVANQQGGVVGL